MRNFYWYSHLTRTCGALLSGYTTVNLNISSQVIVIIIIHHTTHSIAWVYFRSKCEGVIGIRKTEDTDAAFLAKQGWKIWTQSYNIWVGLVKAKYLKKNTIDFLKVNNLIRHPMLAKAFYVIEIYSRKVLSGISGMWNTNFCMLIRWMNLR